MNQVLTRRFLYTLALLCVFLRALELIRSDDFFMCLSLGRQFLHDGFAGTDPFIFSIADFPWHVWHQWLAYVYYFGLYSISGFTGIIVFKAALVTLMLGLILYSGRRNPAIYAIAIMMTSLYIASPRLFADRAAVFTDLFTLGLITVFSNDNLFRRVKWGIPLVFALWVQLHPGFVLGFILLGLYLLTKSPRRESLIVLGISLAAVVINPLGLVGALYPLRTVLSPEWSIYRTMNSEWVPTLSLGLLPYSFRGLFGFFVVGSTLWIVRQAWVTRDRFAILCGLFLAVLGFSALRFVVISGLGLGLLLAKSSSPTLHLKNPQVSRAAYLLTLILLFAGIIINAFSAQHGPRILALVNPLHGSIPYKSAKLFAHLPPGPVWNDFDLGGLLVWELDGRMKVAAHGHIDRPSLVVANYQRWTASEADFKELIDGHKVEYFYLRRSSLLAERNNFWPKKLVTEWELVYEDLQAVIFRRRQVIAP